jgi:hypothetical protein
MSANDSISTRKVIMFRILIRFVLICLLANILGGCATKSSGHRLEELNSPIQKLSYVIYLDKYSNLIAGHEVVDKSANELLTLLMKRTPVVLSLNGIKTTPPKNSQYELRVFPRSANYHSSDNEHWDVEFFMAASIIDRTQRSKKIWEGEVTIVNSSTAVLNEKAVDEFVTHLLAQLAEDKVMKFESGGIKLPL